MPIAIKDLCYTIFAPTQIGATIFKSFVPSFNATVVVDRRASPNFRQRAPA
ncbi:MAG TPA: hypothetical protein VIJ63_11105 [Roseiarcus sp.]